VISSMDKGRPAPQTTCVWCNSPFPLKRRRGSPQKFCSAAHRHAFWSAARCWVMQELRAARLTVKALKAPYESAHASGRAARTRQRHINNCQQP
jgi:hypothetical protein